MRRSIRAIGVTCEYVLYDYLIHFPYFAVRTLLSPALYLFGFGLGVGALTQAGESAYFEYIFPGVLMISVMQASYTHFSTEIWISRQVDKYLELLMMVAPIYPLEAVAGYLIAGTLISLFAAGCFVLMAMVLEPKFLVLDEPTSMLDVITQAQIIRLLQEIQKEKGLAYLFITHDLELARLFCRRIYCLVDGKLQEMLTVRSASRESDF